MEKILQALHHIKTQSHLGEARLHEDVAVALRQAGIPFVREAGLGAGARIDFLCGSIGIEVKQKRPQPSALKAQLMRYAMSDQITALVVVAGRGVRLPQKLGGKPVHVVCLDRQWGVAL